MTTIAQEPTAPVDGSIESTVDRASVLLADVCATADELTRLEARKLRLAVAWAELHPGDEVDTSIPWEQRDLELAGDGAPTVAEFSIAEFALAAGMTTNAGITYVGDAVELRHRLPRTWARVQTGEVPGWKARRVAQSTRSLPPEAAAYVDTHLAPVAHKCSLAQLDRTVEAARAEYDPAAAAAERIAATEHRRFDIHLDQVGTDGLVHVDGLLDLDDALALEAVVSARARDLADTLPQPLPLDARRAIALGLLGAPGTRPARREIVIHAHTRPGAAMVEVENTGTVINTDQLHDWCAHTGTKVSVQPVIDLPATLAENLAEDAYEPSPALLERVRLTHPICVFPGCTRPSRRCDADHIVPWVLGGPTSWWNLAPLCRGHHRLKTHSGWTYARTGPTSFTWTGSTGHTYQVDSARHIG